MKKLLVLGMLALAGLAMAQPKVFKGTEPGRAGGAYRVTSISDPRTWNPFVARETSSTDIIALFLPYLTTYDPYTQAPEGRLAKSWEVRNNGLTVIFKLREGAKWSDGQAIDADDVIFSATVHADQRVNSNSRSNFILDGQPIKWTKVDQFTVRADFPKPYAPALIQGWYIVPEHIFGPAWTPPRPRWFRVAPSSWIAMSRASGWFWCATPTTGAWTSATTRWPTSSATPCRSCPT